MNRIEEGIALANQMGFEGVGELKREALIFRAEVRQMCSADRCHAYGKNWCCPPGCGTIEEAAQRVEGYSRGVIVQTVGQLEDEFDFESMQETARIHQERFAKLVAQLKTKWPEVFPMGAGTCTICKECTYPEAPCRFPDRAIPSMEAYGLWVSDVCEKSGIPYSYGKNTIAYTSCFLLP
ncbi:MAG: DUF2284 domain-containing protein [Oscillospiraceae bacterium]|nr:DUF2284 domain-containing protein [Oscillospiraceae bacterium]